jgi:hypothetical protein
MEPLARSEEVRPKRQDTGKPGTGFGIDIRSMVQFEQKKIDGKTLRVYSRSG